MAIEYKKANAEGVLKCLEWEPKIIETRLGPIEYADRGEGPAVLSVHGGPGGYDQALGLIEVFRTSGFRVIAPSRAGYLGTPANNGTTYEKQADMHAALLEALEIDQATVVGVSAGGPSSYCLAQNYPDKVKALIPIDAVCMEYTKLQEVNKTEEFLYLSKPGLWFVDYLMKHFPASMVQNFLKTESTLDKHDIKKRIKEVVGDEDRFAFMKLMMATVTKHYKERKRGLDIDIDILTKIDKVAIDKISCPTLIVHGRADGDVPPHQAEYARNTIKNSELLWVEKGSHIGFWLAADAYDVQKKTIEWLRDQH
jgi:pimeloyl-ACP methyl ester carboxylesterase